MLIKTWDFWCTVFLLHIKEHRSSITRSNVFRKGKWKAVNVKKYWLAQKVSPIGSSWANIDLCRRLLWRIASRLRPIRLHLSSEKHWLQLGHLLNAVRHPRTFLFNQEPDPEHIMYSPRRAVASAFVISRCPLTKAFVQSQSRRNVET